MFYFKDVIKSSFNNFKCQSKDILTPLRETNINTVEQIKSSICRVERVKHLITLRIFALSDQLTPCSVQTPATFRLWIKHNPAGFTV